MAFHPYRVKGHTAIWGQQVLRHYFWLWFLYKKRFSGGMDILLFEPIYQERVWGGNGLAVHLGRTLPAGGPIGESWEICDRAEANNRISEGTHAGKTLREVIFEDAASIMGPHWPREKTFPVLVKWLDARERLSLQVHPPASKAAELKGEPKSENWYVAHAEQGAALMAGFKRGVTPEQFSKALEANQLEPLVHRFAVEKGDSLFVHSGRIHALDAGNIILEIQQNSDTTYRVYDWGRVGLDGKPRALHIKESLASIDWEDFEPLPIKTNLSKGELLLTHNDCFRLRKLTLSKGEKASFAALEQARIVSVVEGSVVCDQTGQRLAKSVNALLPYAGSFSLQAEENSVLLVTDSFSSL